MHFYFLFALFADATRYRKESGKQRFLFRLLPIIMNRKCGMSNVMTKAMVSMCFTFLLLGSLIGKHPTVLFLIMQTHLCPNIVYTWKPKWPR